MSEVLDWWWVSLGSREPEQRAAIPMPPFIKRRVAPLPGELLHQIQASFVDLFMNEVSVGTA